LICPQEDLTLVPFKTLSCEIPIVFQQYEQDILGFKFTASDFQIHSMMFSLFASLIAPFGGFFASGFKRAIKVKDFSDVIPGHGGITDRMDCQFLMVEILILFIKREPSSIYTSINSFSENWSISRV
jgi:phosphatidate cytidylyltransferase